MTRDTLQSAADAAKAQMPDNTGFILLTVPFGNDDEAIAQYISNMNREDAIKCLKVMLFRWGIDEDWMKDAR